MIEVIKYSSKIFTNPEGEKRTKCKKIFLCIAAYHEIIKALKGRRIFERFGFNLPLLNKKTSIILYLHDFKEWIFQSVASDWVEVEGAGILSGYVPPPELTAILSDHLNTSLK